MEFLKEHYKRENSESEIAKDKKTFGWRVRQKKEDRINRAIHATMVWHNLPSLTQELCPTSILIKIYLK